MGRLLEIKPSRTEEDEEETTWTESLTNIFCCFRICQKTEFNEHGLGMYMASQSEVSLIKSRRCN